MAEKRKPQEDLVKLAGRAMTHPEQLTGSDIKRMAARILDDQKNDAEPGKAKPSIASQVMAKVGDLLPEALKSDDKAKDKPAAKAKAAPAAKPAGKTEAAPAPKPAGKGKAAAPEPKPAPKAVTEAPKKTAPKQTAPKPKAATKK